MRRPLSIWPLLASTLFALSVVVLGRPGLAAAEARGWSEPTQVSTSTPRQVDWFPSIAADNFGNVHVVWNSTPYDDSKGQFTPKDGESALGQLAYTRWNGSTWTPQTDLAVVWYGYALRTSLALDPTGQLHLIYKGYGSAELQQFPRSIQDLFYTSAMGPQADSSSAWSRRQEISQGGVAYFSDLAIDSKGVIHAIWTENDTTTNYGLFYSRSANGGATWSQPVSLAGDEPVWWFRAHLQVDQLDRLHVAWEVGGNDSKSGLPNGVTNKAVYAQSIDGGFTWAKREFTGLPRSSDADPSSVTGPQAPAIGVDGNGDVLLVYREYPSDRIVYRHSADGVLWSAAEAMPGVKGGVQRPYDIYDLATDSAGHVHAVMIGYPSTGSAEMSVLHSEWNLQAWSKADVISSGAPYPEYPRISIGEGNRLHVVWFGGDSEHVSRVPSGIWYSSATSAAPSTFGRVAPLASGQLLSPSTADAARAAATPAIPPVAVPTPQPLTELQRSTYKSTSAIDELGRQPGLPIAAALLLASGLLATVFLARRLTTHLFQH